MVAKEAVLKLPDTPGVLAVASITSVAQLAAVQLIQPEWPFATAAGLAGAAACAAAAGAMRLAQLMALKASSATTVQMANALAMPLGPTLSLWPSVPRQVLEGAAASLVGLVMFACGRVLSPAKTRPVNYTNVFEASDLYKELDDLEDVLRKRLEAVKDIKRQAEPEGAAGDTGANES